MYSLLESLLPIYRLLRLNNLLMVFLTLVLIQYGVFEEDVFYWCDIKQVGFLDFCLFSAAVLVTTASGYIINDYVDASIDFLNEGGKVVVGNWMYRHTALEWYNTSLWILSGLTLVLAFRLGRFWPLWVFPVTAWLLHAYSVHLKCRPLVGNLLVAVLCGLVPLLPLWCLTDIHCWKSENPRELERSPVELVYLFAFFSFLANFFRELVKDLEDRFGDRAMSCGTLAVRNERLAKRIALLSGLLLIFFIIVWIGLLPDFYMRVTGYGLVVAPAALASMRVMTAKVGHHFGQASNIIKWTMFFGISMLMFLR